MAQQAQVKNYWTFVKGFVTEAGPLTFPENTALSLDNIVLDTDGSITPRKGFVDLSTLYVTSSTDDEYERGVTTFQWQAAGGAEAEDLYVVRAGHVVRFFTADDATPSYLSGEDLDLSTYLPAGSAYAEADIDAGICDMASGDGRLYIVTPYTNPIIVEYDVATSSMSVTELFIRERDLEGIDDGTEADFHPASLSAQHAYNLKNAGWNDSKISAYRSDYGVYPSRSEDPWTGVTEEVDPNTGKTYTRFRPGNYRAAGDTGFGTSESAKGHYVLETFDTSTIITADTVATNDTITVTLDNPSGGDPYTDFDGIFVEVETETNVINNGDDVTISGFSYFSNSNPLFNTTYSSVTVTGPNFWTGYLTKTQCDTLGITGILDLAVGASNVFAEGELSDTLDSGQSVVSGSDTTVGTVEDKRFEAVTFYAGRAFYAGCQPDTRQDLNGRVYYSQIIRTKANAKKCHSSNDPSAKDVNDLLDTDGGYITINNLGVVHAMVPFRQSLIIISTNGCWEIGAGEGYFKPSSYSIRQLTDRGSRFKYGVTEIDGRPCYWSQQGLEIISESEITSFPAAQSLTDSTIKSFVQQSITAGSVSSTYDNIDNKAYWAFQESGSTDTRILCFDTRLGAFYTWTIDNNGYHIRSIDHFDNGTDERLRLVVQSKPSASQWQLDLHSQNHVTNNTDYLNSDTEIQYSAFIESGYELQGDGMRNKQAIKVATYCERDENASLYARGKYDWTTSGTAGKWSNSQQAYRDAGEGHGVSISRLRMRGSGPAFRIRYESDGTKDFKLYGWSVLFTGGSNV